MPYTELQAAKFWMVAKLLANATLSAAVGGRVWADSVQRVQGVLTFPYVLINCMSSVDVPGIGTNRIQTQATFQVRIVCEGPASVTVKEVQAIMDGLLQTAVTETSNGFVFSSRRIREIDRTEYDEVKKPIKNLGGDYRVWMYAA